MEFKISNRRNPLKYDILCDKRILTTAPSIQEAIEIKNRFYTMAKTNQSIANMVVHSPVPSL